MEEDITNAGNVEVSRMRDVASATEDFEQIYRTYRPLLRMIARRKGLPLTDADDRVHDVFASFILHRANVRDPGPYLVGAIRNSARDYWRAHVAERTVFSDADTSLLGDDGKLDDAVMARAAVRATLAALGPSCREVLKRYYLEGETAADIAAQRQTSTGYIHRLLNLCRRRAQAFYASLSRVL